VSALVPAAWPGEVPALKPGAAHVWSVAVGARPGERERARAALSEVLAAYAEADPGEIRIERAACVHCGEPHGKPFLAAPAGHDLRFNLSHSGELALIAVARGREVGVDVEATRPAERAQRIADRTFTEAEAAELRSLAGPEREAAFFRLWARKEAYLKATARGFKGGLDSFDALGLEPLDGSAAGWEFADVEAGPGYAAALALAPPGYSPGG
jgi:4'-phosphopantetheinyl transferase